MKTHVPNVSSDHGDTRRNFIQRLGLGVAALGMTATGRAADVGVAIQGFEEMTDADAYKGWKAVSDRRVRVGIAGCGASKFGAAFGFQDHPNVEVVAVTDLIPERCEDLARRTRCKKTYPSLEEMVKDKSIEAVYVATDAPNHVKHCLEVLKHGKHVAVAVPAAYGSLEDADRLFEAVKKSGLKYMMFETSQFRQDLHAMREIYRAGGFGKIVYSEGEYLHYMPKPIASYLGWRDGAIPMWYPTHATAYHIGVTGGSYTKVSCLGMPSSLPSLQPGANRYKNIFGTQVALFRTDEGGMSRITCSKDTPGFGSESGRVRGTKGSFFGEYKSVGQYQGEMKPLPNTRRTPLPPGMSLGGHGGSHAYLTNDFVHSILQDRVPAVNVAMALNMTVPGIVAHQSALKDGEWLKVPQYRL
jgi:predicted dehydrogenase